MALVSPDDVDRVTDVFKLMGLSFTLAFGGVLGFKLALAITEKIF